MARTPSTMVPLGFKAPKFELYDVISEKILKSEDLFGSKATLLMFICNHCPFVKYVNKQIVEISKLYSSSEIKFIAISSNDVINYPDDAPELMKKLAIDKSFNFPYLIISILRIFNSKSLLSDGSLFFIKLYS